MQLKKPPLFTDTKSFIWTMIFFIVLILSKLFFTYQEYRAFISKPFYYTYADVMKQTKKYKNGKSYSVLKLYSSEGLTFYTTSYKKVSYQSKRLRLQIFPAPSISFKGYLSSFYVKSRIKEVNALPATFKETILKQVSVQHKEKVLASFYNAIFFAAPLEPSLREQINRLGVSHLVALSGFHLTILWGLVYGSLLILYRPLQQRYFPYRFSLIDMGWVALLILGLYLWFVGFPPSLVRSYAMVFAGWIVLLLGIELLSFEFLFAILFALLVIDPALVFSLAFWFSVAGVFAIFLLLQYSKNMDALVVKFLTIPLGIFLLMLPIVHGTFEVTSTYQLLSPILSLLFIPFYPLVMLLHLVGYGGVFDDLLLWLFGLPDVATAHLLPPWMMFSYMVIALLAIRYKVAFVILSICALSYAIYLFVL